MNLYRALFRYYIIFVFSSIVLFLGGGFFIKKFFINDFIKNYSQEKISQIDFIVKKEKQDLEQKVKDWAQWDDAYNFIKTKNKEFIVSNFGGGDTLLTLGINGMIFLDKNLHLVYGRIAENNKEKVINKLPPFDYKKNGFNFYILNNKIYLVYITDITNTNMNKKNGKLVVYKILNKKIFEKNGFNLINVVVNNKHIPLPYELKESNLVVYYPINNKITLALSIDINDKLLIFEKNFLKFFVIGIIVLILLFILGIAFVKRLIKDFVFIFNTLSIGVKDVDELKKLLTYPYHLKELKDIANVFGILYEKVYNYEEIYKILDESVPFGTVIYRENILYANKFFLNMFNLNEKELKNLNPLLFIEDSVLKEKIREINQKRLRGEKIILKYDTHLYYKDKEVYSFIICFPVIYEDNNSIMAFIIDLTKEMKYQEILERILDYIPVVIFEYKKNNEIIITITENIKKILGYKIDEIDKDWWINHLHPKDKPKILNQLNELKQKGKLEYNYRFRKKDNSYIWIHEYVFYKKEKNIKKTYGLWEDITKAEIIKRLNIALSDINKFLIVPTNKKRMIEFICKKFVESEVFKFVWVGGVKDNKVTPIAYFGEGKEYLNDLEILIKDSVLSKGPTGEALYNNNIIGINPNTFTNEKIAPWKEKQIKNGFFSSISIRLIDDLTINLYSEFTDFYTQEIIDIILSIRSSLLMAFEKNKYIKRLEFITYFDEITGLGNFNKFKKDFDNYNGEYFLCLVNIRDFTSINANFGFEFGNEILKKVGDILKKQIKKEDEIYRIYNDRFLLFLKSDSWNMELVKNITNLIYNIFSEKGLIFNNQEIFLEINGSIASSKDIEQKRALESLIYAYIFAKNTINKFVIFEPWMYEEVKERIYLKELLFKAIREKLFDIYFQPIVDLKSYKIVQFEALLRLKDDNKFVNMEKFINIASELQLVPEITKIVVKKVVGYLKIFKSVRKDISVSINISKLDMEEKFLEFFKRNVISNNLEFKDFSIEITERESIENEELTKYFVKELKKLGIKLEIDDFGVAYSNFERAVSIDFDILKIDKSFVDKIFEEKIQIAVKSIIFLAKSFNAKTIAEGVETKEQLEILKELGVDYIQGYYFAKPMPFDEAVKYLKSNM